MFVNRDKEIKRVKNALGKDQSQLIVIYGRRRCGKSSLLQYVLPAGAVFFSADLREKPLQINALAKQIEQVIPVFSKLIYPDWESLFMNLNTSLNERTVICIDEFPYLVKNSPELPSVLQNLIDNRITGNYHLVLCGSSQQMMHSMVLDKTSPLYGRCDEIIRIRPMSVRYMNEFLGLSAIESIEEYGVWGGVPRYWEIRKQYGTIEEAIKESILDQNGLLYEEPERLFADEMRTSVLAYSILSLIGSGVHRPSEIAARLGKPATQLSRPIGFLVNQGYIRREVPFGENSRTTKRSLYKIDDAFMNFYFTFLVPNKSRLEFDMINQVWEEISERYSQFVSHVWEDLCRKSIPFIEIDGKSFYPAMRWWGTGLSKKQMEIDLLAQSTDGKALLIGEVKWTESVNIERVSHSLNQKIENLPINKPPTIFKAVFQQLHASHPEVYVFTPDDVIGALG